MFKLLVLFLFAFLVYSVCFPATQYIDAPSQNKTFSERLPWLDELDTGQGG